MLGTPKRAASPPPLRLAHVAPSLNPLPHTARAQTYLKEDFNSASYSKKWVAGGEGWKSEAEVREAVVSESAPLVPPPPPIAIRHR